MLFRLVWIIQVSSQIIFVLFEKFLPLADFAHDDRPFVKTSKTKTKQIRFRPYARQKGNMSLFRYGNSKKKAKKINELTFCYKNTPENCTNKSAAL